MRGKNSAGIFFLVDFFILVFMGPAIAAQENSVDRVVIEVNQSAYTQRQMQAYLILNASISKGKISIDDIPSPSNWKQMLRQFQSEMIIEQEAMRLTSFSPSQAMVERAEQVVQANTKNDRLLEQQWNVIGIGKDTRFLRRTILALLRVEAFKRARRRQQEAAQSRSSDNPGGMTGTQVGNPETWLSELEGRIVVRYFDHSKTFVELAPF